MKTDTSLAEPPTPSPINKHRTLFMTLISNVDLTSAYAATYPTVAASFGNGAYKGTIEEAIAHANTQSATQVKSGGTGLIYVLGVVAVVRPKLPVEPPTIVERFDIPTAQ